jgi:hypothetical protein
MKEAYKMNETLSWLLDGDPSVRWQVKKDLMQNPDFESDRQKIETEGWGKKLLEKQDPEGTWAGNYYSPKWISTHYTTLLLRRLGLDQNNPQAQKACWIMLEKGFQPNGGISYWKTWPLGETCVTGMTLGMLAYFHIHDDRLEKFLDYMADQQLPDGGWNCNHPKKKVHHSSMHTTYSVLDGLYELGEFRPHLLPRIREMRNKAHEFLLQHRLYKSDKTGNIIDSKMTRLSFPPRWHYQVHLILDYFQKINHPYDERFTDAIDLLKNKRENNTWPMQQRYGGKQWFSIETVGKPSRINTLIMLRVLKWWDRISL